MELVSDYDCEFHYYPNKVNKVVDALSRKSMAFAISVEKMSRPSQADICDLEMEVIIGKLLALTIQPTIMAAIKGSQLIDLLMQKFKKKNLEEGRSIFFVLEDGVLGYKGGRICVPNDEEIKK